MDNSVTDTDNNNDNSQHNVLSAFLVIFYYATFAV